MAPIQTLLINVVPPRLSVRAQALQRVGMHLFGDMISPPLIGYISDRTSSLQSGMQLVWVSGLLAFIVWTYSASVFAQSDEEQADSPAIAKSEVLEAGYGTVDGTK